jgi:hypothetical protein
VTRVLSFQPSFETNSGEFPEVIFLINVSFPEALLPKTHTILFIDLIL